MEEQQVVEKVLTGLPAKFDSIAITIKHSKDLSDYSIRVVT